MKAKSWGKRAHLETNLQRKEAQVIGETSFLTNKPLFLISKKEYLDKHIGKNLITYIIEECQDCYDTESGGKNI